MKKLINRRSFIMQSVQVATGVALIDLAAEKSWSTKPKPLFQISLAQWSLHRAIFSKQLDNLDFAMVAKKDYGFDAVEYVNQFFKDKGKDLKYLNEMKKRAKDYGVKSRLIMVDGEGALGDPDKAKRMQAIENHYKWVEAAKLLGCFCIRVNAYSTGSYDEQIELAAEGLRKLTEFGAKHKMAIIVENHGGLSSNGAWLASLIKKVNHPMCGTLPDFANFDLGNGEYYDRYQGVKELMPFAKAVSAKAFEFDENGNEKQIDYRRMMKIVVDAGFRSYVGLEYEGDGLSEPDGIRATKKLLERVRNELS